ncbi:GCN5-related N-acetyltransferase [Pseudoxanthomonas suwonensis 11-1]|uniref:GCN5-related N-acetyltransferase n=1 Tax=Pseudoxanthomonas suwonensis (strain 11-1) TaxID=743721 RepID=E6WRC9_PSEUU|nr:GNAT family N-acetyltransferase [Pseudoxanthomonas suwonensis]ADV26587.1 GCN5-related N-acetyltransferase [Pseudoxanthomonas suwonensis 11-1]
MPTLVRRAAPGDMQALLELVAEHAAFEQATARPDAQALSEAIFGARPRLLCWVAAGQDAPAGYMTATCDFSTWQARPFLYMDCLYLRATARNHGLGARLLDALREHARLADITRLQWQTPEWNQAAARFYRRQGARELRKRRFVLELEEGEG